MARRKTRIRKSGFTLVELLVVISIIGMLVGLLLPAINNARESGRRTVCQNNMRNVSTALINYENSRNMFPGYINVLVMNNGKAYMNQQTGQKSAASFVMMILRQLDRPDLDMALKTPAGASMGGGSAGSSSSSASGSSGSTGSGLQNGLPKLEILICPSDPPTSDTGTPTSYVVNSGMQDTQGSASMPRDWAENGVFFDRYTGNQLVTGSSGGGGGGSGGGGNSSYQMISMTSAFIARSDGLQNTLLISENVDGGNYTDQTEAKLGIIWNGTGTVNTGQSPPNLNPPDDNMRINRGTGMSDLQGGSVQTTSSSASQSTTSQSSSPQGSIFARPSSYHPNGVNMVFCDSHLKFVSDQIDYYVYCMLMSSYGQRVRKPGTQNVLPNFNRAIDDSWIY
jgi:prepilin-type N-terminal cleavage/methylation domain-containing protein/prepilin-type processing-associated H-X9-DG protein